MKRYLGFSLGVIAGCVALLSVQAFWKPAQPPAETQPGDGRGTLTSNRLEKQLADARGKITDLEAQLESRDEGWGSAPLVDHDAEIAETPEDKASAFIELIQSLAKKEERDGIDADLDDLTKALELREDQIGLVREAMEKTAAERQAAGIRLVTGTATIQDLLLADEDNPVPFDSALAEILDDGQREEYGAIQEERERIRVAKKTEEEMRDLLDGTELAEEQQRAAWEVLAEINAGERPAEVPEGTTEDDFYGYLDGAIDKRLNGLQPILTDEQMDTYTVEAEEFRENIISLVRHATGSKEEP